MFSPKGVRGFRCEQVDERRRKWRGAAREQKGFDPLSIVVAVPYDADADFFKRFTWLCSLEIRRAAFDL